MDRYAIIGVWLYWSLNPRTLALPAGIDSDGERLCNRTNARAIRAICAPA